MDYQAKHLDSGLKLTTGQQTATGSKEENEDSMGLWVPDGSALALKGAAFVVADGVSIAEAAREASDICVKTFLDDYFSTPDSWTVETSGTKVIEAINRWLFSLGRSLPEAACGYVTTMSALVLKSQTAHLFHVGDTRIYRFRDAKLEQLTTDHARKAGPKLTLMARAMGLDAGVVADYETLALAKGDVFLLSTDGVHDTLDASLLSQTLADHPDDFDAACDSLIRSALARGSEDNLTCQLVRVDELPDPDAGDIYRRLTDLPFPPKLEVGETLDGYRVQKVLHRSERSNVYLVVDQQSGKEAVMKTPSELYKDDPAYIERFIMERWVQSRIHHKNVLQSVDAPNHPSYLYSLSEHIEGQRLADWIEAHPDPSMEEVLPIIKQIALGVEALHRRETLHQDLKPDNILIGSDGIVKLLDFGSCRVAGIDEIDLPVTRDTMLGTVYYSAPEYRRGQRADRNADLFSIGVIAYEMITGYLPYEEQIEDIHSDADIDKLTYVPSYHRRPSVPVWVDGALWKAVRIDPAKRYEEISEFVFDLEFPNRLFARDAMTPLLQPSPVRNWKIVCALLFFLNLLFIYLLATSGTK